MSLILSFLSATHGFFIVIFLFISCFSQEGRIVTEISVIFISQLQLNTGYCMLHYFFTDRD